MMTDWGDDEPSSPPTPLSAAAVPLPLPPVARCPLDVPVGVANVAAGALG
jgi:hypothetical protein